MTQTPQDRPDAPVPPPAGWYPDAVGQLRWWDGRSWTFAVQERAPDRTWAVISHLSGFAFPVVAALVIRLTLGRRDPYVRHHATEALNIQILFTVVWNVVGVTMLVVLAATATRGPDAGPPWPFFAVLPVLMLLGVLLVVGTVVGAIRASAGVWWRYPVNLRLVRGAVRPEQTGSAQLPR